ncbi:hypothetical protein SAMN05421504_103909 [Amycolatopsis xylanica]|uniref:SH3 domain-containing protein n=1 Tax=Amycolatopsis xylanica TaxID=589385 RepID=A0A1H3ER03_9PSEU|nr:hypothetical protein [Amycolatopsis xylanica]SDX80389.1 hypothetical protein SAMN05421504_103909 [Amycolatopsis xylanica]
MNLLRKITLGTAALAALSLGVPGPANATASAADVMTAPCGTSGATNAYGKGRKDMTVRAEPKLATNPCGSVWWLTDFARPVHCWKYGQDVDGSVLWYRVRSDTGQWGYVPGGAWELVGPHGHVPRCG